MKHRHILQAAASISAVAASLAVGATAATASTASTAEAAKAKPVTVTVRVEGLNKTLLQSQKVTLKPGSVKRDGNKCGNQTVQGALNVATKGKWSGPWSTEYGPEWEIFSVLGETHNYNTSPDYWEEFVNNKAAQAGACQVSLKNGNTVLFAVANDTETAALPISVTARKTVVKDHKLTVHVYYDDATGTRHPLAGATVKLTGKTVTTSATGVATIKATATGKRTVFVHDAGYIRDEAAITVKH